MATRSGAHSLSALESKVVMLKAEKQKTCHFPSYFHQFWRTAKIIPTTTNAPSKLYERTRKLSGITEYQKFAPYGRGDTDKILVINYSLMKCVHKCSHVSWFFILVICRYEARFTNVDFTCNFAVAASRTTACTTTSTVLCFLFLFFFLPQERRCNCEIFSEVASYESSFSRNCGASFYSIRLSSRTKSLESSLHDCT